jgi:1,4-alpha-glucan branching enzyme
MRHKRHTRRRHRAAKLFGRGAGFVPANPEADDPVIGVPRRKFCHRHRPAAAVLANTIDNPVHWKRRPPCLVVHRGVHLFEVQFLPPDHPGRQRNLGIRHALPAQRRDQLLRCAAIILRLFEKTDRPLEGLKEAGKVAAVPLGGQLGIGNVGGKRALQMDMEFGFRNRLQEIKHCCHNRRMLREEIDAILGGYHGDPFRILGPHGGEVRAFLPQAEAVSLVRGDLRVPMRKEHDGGFWIGEWTGSYRLAITLAGEETIEAEDPYRFWPVLSEFDLHLHGEGTLYRAWETLGAHRMEVDGVDGVLFAVWAPNAQAVSVTGDCNEWDTRRHPMRMRDGGVWELFIPGVTYGMHYKYFVKSKYNGYEQLKCDPYGFQTEVPPKTASVVADLSTYSWTDQTWLEERAKRNALDEPMAVYEVHLESWMRQPDGRSLSYRELAVTLVEYVKRLNYTHIELLPIMEYPYSGSWGYQVTGFYAPTARFGVPDDFKYFVDRCHAAGIGVIVDWVPGHYPRDAHGLAFFDGTALYEHADPRKGEHKGWGTLVFNYGRSEVVSFLISNALFWLEQYHIDGLRVDAVASMLYLDYCREPGEWIPNEFGGRENLEAIAFLRQCNTEVHKIPGAVTIAEESTSFVGVSRPVYTGGLGFTMKWNMGWMHDMFAYFKHDPVFRKFNQNHITFSLLYAFTENFLLPISHDEVVHGKSALIGKMPGDEWQRFANVRAFLGYMYTHPGKKLLFMGQEIGQYEEWDEKASCNWAMLDYPFHRQLQHFVAELNALYRRQPALYERDNDVDGFDWVDFRDVESSVISFNRKAKDPRDWLLVVCNFTPMVRRGYRIGVHEPGTYIEILNSDSHLFGGSNVGNHGWVLAEEIPNHGRPYSVSLTLPPLGVLVFKRA